MVFQEVPLNVLILCTGNSARSILGEALVNHLGRGRFKGFSAGSHPKGHVHPMALRVLQEKGLLSAGMRSKSWDEFAAPGAPTIDFVFTVCDNAAGEVCPIWPGTPMKAHWGIDDPAAVIESESRQHAAFMRAYDELEHKIFKFVNLPVRSMPPGALMEQLRLLGRSTSSTSSSS